MRQYKDFNQALLKNLEITQLKIPLDITVFLWSYIISTVIKIKNSPIRKELL